MYELHKELKRRGHDIKFWSLIEALTICHHAGLTLCNASGHVVLKSPIFPILLLSRAGRVTEFGDIGQRFQPKEHLVLVLG